MIRILFYARGTGFGLIKNDLPFTIAHISAGSKEVALDRNTNEPFDIDTFFTFRDSVSDKRLLPGYVQLVSSEADIINPKLEQVFNKKNGGTAGHLYQRLIDFNLMAVSANKFRSIDNQIPIYKIYTLIDDNDDTNSSDYLSEKSHLNYLFNRLKEGNYSDSFFDVCIAASKGLGQLIHSINRYNLDTSLVLINGGTGDHLKIPLQNQSKIKAIVLTHGHKDEKIISKTNLLAFVNNNAVKIFIYVNKLDDHIPASLVLGNTKDLHKSMLNKTNRMLNDSYLPLLVNSAYYVCRKGKSWDYLYKFLSHDKNIIYVNNINNS